MDVRVGALLLAQLLVGVELGKRGELRRGLPADPGVMGEDGARGHPGQLTFSSPLRVAGSGRAVSR